MAQPLPAIACCPCAFLAPRTPAAAAAAAGLPHSLAKTKQALRRRYAVAAMSSLDRKEGGGGRCFQW